MTRLSRVSRKDLGEDRIAICPIFGCLYMERVKPLKFRFFGFGKNPKCKEHHYPLVYLDERIETFVEAALACLFDKGGLPSNELLSLVVSKYPNELQSFLQGWVYCITTGRGAPIVSRYLDSISKLYMKKLNRKQHRAFRNEDQNKFVEKYQAIKLGRKELATQYARFLKHLRVHSEVLVNVKNLKSLSTNLRYELKKWQEEIVYTYLDTNFSEGKDKLTPINIKHYYDQILNVGTCRCLIGMDPEVKRIKLSAFDRFSAYLEFNSEKITEKFTKFDLKKLESGRNMQFHIEEIKSENEMINRQSNLDNEKNSDDLILIYSNNLNEYHLVEVKKAKINDDSHILGLDNSGRLKNIRINQLIENSNCISYSMIFKHGTLTLSEHYALLSVDSELNFIKIPVKKLEKGMPILIPRQINVVENDTPLDFRKCGKTIIENGIEYIQKGRTKTFRFVEKNFELGYILGHYCAEGAMNVITFSCGNDKKEMEKVANMIYRNFGYKPFFGKSIKGNYDPVFNINSNSMLLKEVFTKGLGLNPELSPYKEIPPFLYNAPIECIKGFLTGFTKGDGSIEEITRNREYQSSPSRDIDYRLHSSSIKLIFGLNFLLKRIGVNAKFEKREFDDIKHPTWHDAYTLRIKGRGNLEKLRNFIPNLPSYSNFARGEETEIDLNPWMKKINKELKDMYKISLRMLVEGKKIPYMAAKCAQSQNRKNLSEYRLIKTLKYLIQNNYKTQSVRKLWHIFSKFTFTTVKEVNLNNNQNKGYNLIIPYYGTYISGIGQIFVNIMN